MQNLIDVVEQKQKENRVKQLDKRFNQNQTFTERYEEIKNVIVPLSYLLNAASALGAMYAIYFSFQFLANSITLALLICGALLFAIERLKRAVYRSYFDKVVLADPTNGWAIGVFALIVVSLGSTAFGTYKGTIDLAPAAAIIQTDTTLTYLQGEAERLKNNIAASERTTWKGKITTRSQSAIKEYSKSQNKLYEAIAARMGMIDNENEGITTDHKKDVQTAAIIVLIIAVCIELALLACMYFLSKYAAYQYFEMLPENPTPPTNLKAFTLPKSLNGNYSQPVQNDIPNRVQIKGFKRKTIKDKKQINHPTITIQTTDNQVNNENRKPPNENRKPPNENHSIIKNIVVKDANLRECKHCQTEYIYKHNKQKYCSDNCRMLAWKDRQTVKTQVQKLNVTP